MLCMHEKKVLCESMYIYIYTYIYVYVYIYVCIYLILYIYICIKIMSTLTNASSILTRNEKKIVKV